MNSEGFVSCQHLLRPESLVFSVLQRQARGEKRLHIFEHDRGSNL